MTGEWVEVPTFTARVYVAGDRAVAEQTCREFCFGVGLCVTVEPTRFVYTGGEESGVAVGLVNYPRFPSDPEELREKAKRLAVSLMERCCQWSALVVCPDRTEWITRRPGEGRHATTGEDSPR